MSYRHAHRIIKLLHKSALAVLILFAMTVSKASAQNTTYTFQSTPFNTFTNASCPPVCRITGSFTVSKPLPPNLVQGIGGSGDFLPVAFSFTDGLTTFSNANIPPQLGGTVGFSFDTDSGGNITFWSFYASAQAVGQLFSYYEGPGNTTQEGVNLIAYQAYFDGYGAIAGVWTRSPTIEVLDQGVAVTDLTLAPTLPKNAKFRPNYNPKSLSIGCFDASSNPIPNCKLAVDLVSTTISGGHQQHNFPRPPGEIVTPDNIEALSADGSSLASETLSITTDSSGTAAQVIYLPTLVGGDVVAKITETGGLGIPENDLMLHIRSPYADCPDPQFASSVALCQLPLIYSTYTLTGSTTTHPDNHFGERSFVTTTLPGIAFDWFNVPIPYLPVPQLAINDMSLVDGGVFDYLNANWKPPHAAHRWGDEADIGSGTLPPGITVPKGNFPINYWLPAPQRQRLRAILAHYHYEAINEDPCLPGLNETLCSHYHIRPSAVGKVAPTAPINPPPILLP